MRPDIESKQRACSIMMHGVVRVLVFGRTVSTGLRALAEIEQPGSEAISALLG